MAKSNNNLKAVLEDTANAIRNKTGSNGLISPRDFADEIDSIETGGGGVVGNVSTELMEGNVTYVEDAAVEMLSPYAFTSTALQSVNLPNCKIINQSAFNSCYGLTDVSLPNARIIFSGFGICQALVSLELPNCVIASGTGLTTGTTAFPFRSLSLPNCIWNSGTLLPSIGGINSLYAPKLISMAFSACYNCKSLTQVDFPCLGILPRSGFMNTGLINISFPCAYSTWETVFANCQSLQTAFIPNLIHLSASVFSSCHNLSSLTLLTMSASLINTNAFANTPMSNSSYLGYFGSIYVPSQAVASFKAATNWAAYSDRITAADSSFDSKYAYGYEFYNSTIASIPVSKTNVENVGPCAFRDCTSLTDVDLPNCKIINESAFDSCNYLSSINLPKCEIVFDYAFNYCSLSSISLPKCKYLLSNAFSRNNNLRLVDLPECLYVGQYAFGTGASNLQINLPKCQMVNESAFAYCAVASVSLPECLYVGQDAFSNCSNLTTLNLPKCIYLDSAIKNCAKLTSVNLPECLYIASYNFQQCVSLRTINIPKCEFFGEVTFPATTTLTIYLTGSKIVNMAQFGKFPSTVQSIYVRASFLSYYQNSPRFSNVSSKFIGLTDEEIANL